MVNNISEEAAEILIDLKCINFSPKKQFKLTSGKKVLFIVTVGV